MKLYCLTRNFYEDGDTQVRIFCSDKQIALEASISEGITDPTHLLTIEVGDPNSILQYMDGIKSTDKGDDVGVYRVPDSEIDKHKDEWSVHQVIREPDESIQDLFERESKIASEAEELDEDKETDVFETREGDTKLSPETRRGLERVLG